MGQEQMGMKEAMKKMKEQTAEMALNAQRDAEAAAAEREAAEAQLAETQAAVEAEQNNVKSVEVQCPTLYSVYYLESPTYGSHTGLLYEQLLGMVEWLNKQETTWKLCYIPGSFSKEFRALVFDSSGGL